MGDSPSSIDYFCLEIHRNYMEFSGYTSYFFHWFFAFSGPKISFRFVLQLWNFELGHYVVFAKIYVFWLKFVLTHWIDAVHWSSLMLLEIWFHRFQSGNYLLHLYFTSALYSNCPSVIQLTFIVAET